MTVFDDDLARARQTLMARPEIRPVMAVLHKWNPYPEQPDALIWQVIDAEEVYDTIQTDDDPTLALIDTGYLETGWGPNPTAPAGLITDLHQATHPQSAPV